MSNPKTEVEGLMNRILPFVKKQLEDDGQFYPCAGAIRTDGEFVVVATETGEEFPDPRELVEWTKRAFRKGAKEGKYRATALIYDSLVMPPGQDQKVDAIAAALDHKDGYSVVVFFPYVLSESRLEFGEVFAVEGEYDVFVH